jgi:AraC-like DNA-binding protein
MADAKRMEFGGLATLRLEALSVTALKSATGTVSVAANVNVFGINVDGAVIARPASSNRVLILPSQSVFFAKGPLRLSALAARGDHRLQFISWHSSALPALDQWIQNYGPNRSVRGLAKRMGCRPIDGMLADCLKRLDEAKAQNNPMSEPLMVSVVHEAVGRIMVGDDEVQLSVLPGNLPEALQNLAMQVRMRPAGNWSLKEASEMASYSPFHFSRVFKQLAGFGFHEFVERCRTEHAVSLLVNTELSVDHVATQSGFGTTQGLRESVRDYLGLVPSEFRSLPEIFEPTTVA